MSTITGIKERRKEAHDIHAKLELKAKPFKEMLEGKIEIVIRKENLKHCIVLSQTKSKLTCEEKLLIKQS